MGVGMLGGWGTQVNVGEHQIISHIFDNISPVTMVHGRYAILGETGKVLLHLKLWLTFL